MTQVLAIDPGNTESAYALIDADTRRPVEAAKIGNDTLIDWLCTAFDGGEGFSGPVAIEMVASYGMAVGREVFETCVWIGRFAQTVEVFSNNPEAELVYRREVKLHHCHNAGAKDANLIQALVDRFAPGQPNKGKGTKADPGWFHGFAADMWQAYALAVVVADRLDPHYLGV